MSDQKDESENAIVESDNFIDHLQTGFDPSSILKRGEEEYKASKVAQEDDGEDELGIDEEPVKKAASGTLTYESALFKAMTLNEFKNGLLLTTIVPEQYTTFGIDMLRRLQEEYSCTSISEQATAELATLSFIRTLELQNIINTSLARTEKHSLNITYISVVSKELDRANRQYLNAIQTLRMLKQPPLKVNVKANTAIIGQNQVIQEEQNVNSI